MLKYCIVHQISRKSSASNTLSEFQYLSEQKKMAKSVILKTKANQLKEKEQPIGIPVCVATTILKMQCKSSITRIIEPPRDKTNNVVVHPAKTQISLGICPV